MGKLVDITGNKYGKLTVIEFSYIAEDRKKFFGYVNATVEMK